MNNTTVTTVGAPLQYIPVRMNCGHFELRLTRWNGFNAQSSDDPPSPGGFLQAGAVCTQCNAQGRAVSPNYETLELAQRAAAVKNEGKA